MTRFCAGPATLLLALVWTGNGLGASRDSGADSGAREMLPTTVTPEHYRIDITPDASALTFKGVVDIDISVHRATDKIVLNGADLHIDNAALAGEPKSPAISYDDKLQRLTLALTHPLKPGAYTLTLHYRGRIYRQASGLFALDYDTPNGKARALFTQFENSDARRFVPSWDEPGRKATFELTATAPAEQMPISNMPITATQMLPGNLKRVHFATTPKMSTYLLFYGVGNFERAHRDVEGVDVGVVVKRGDLASAEYALNAAADILPYYNRYFGTPYPLPKLDLIAGPGTSQFFGAMENWGAIFYFERFLLVDARVSTQTDKQWVYVVVAHEMSHQWFGDLVTMAWWDDLWLNEGFASWMENKVTDHFHPEWKIWLQALSDKQSAMREDADDGTHAIISPIKDVLQASSAFDAITYLKGAAVIRTLESFLGEDAFRAGVRRYMHDHAYGNTLTDDLWKELDQASTRPITRMAHDLTLQAGVPMVIEESSRCEHERTRLELSQGHFAIDPGSTPARIWEVPVIAATLGGASATSTVSGPAPQSVELPGCGPVILNAGQTGYFRSRYTNQSLAALASNFAALLPDDQLGVVNDTNSLALVGQEPMAAFLQLAKNFPADADPIVVTTLVSRLRELDRMYDGLANQMQLRAYLLRILDPIFARLGWDKRPGESDNTALLRADLLAALGWIGDSSVRAEARRRFERYLSDPSSLDAGTRRSVLQVVAMQCDPTTWGELHDLARSAKTELERQELYNLLATPEDLGLVHKALDLALSGEPPTTITPEMIDAAADRYPDQAFDFAVAHWDKVGPLIEPSTQARFVPQLLRTATDPRLIDRLNAFAAAHIPPSARRDLRKSEAQIRYAASIRKERLPEVDRWLNGQ